MLPLSTAFIVAFTLGSGVVSGHRGCGGAELRSLQSRGIVGRQVTDEASAAQSTDPSTECVAYSYQPVTDIKSSFPTIWQTATLVSGDTEASDLFASINATVNSKLPTISPKGINADKTTVPEPETWGLGFDDGPNCSHNAFYDFLRDAGQKATIYMTSFTNEEAFAELYYTRKAIKEVLGVTPTCWRPPYGDVDNRIRLIAQELNLTNYVWSDDSEDWRAGATGSNVTEADVTAYYQSVVSKVSNGTYSTSGPMVLTHELTNFTMSEFMSQYASIKAAFKYIVPLASAFNVTQPYVETNVTYPDFSTYTNQSSSSSSSASSSSSSGTSAAVSGSASAAAGTGSAAKSSASCRRTARGSAIVFGVSVVGWLLSQ
ncbi:uncharacterized protein IL334_006330 [Kwoniella shivajii]|uniref:chitin deacetylase n=1 Tax=Kwoniella shivajii TaxID=564305 RepID=A0ABZ1D683_9TREE|nr:hypothetical protein IL334_006330 [Kwoniella shivajii]